MGYDVELDLWCVDGAFYLGHDEPKFEVTLDWIVSRKERAWVHCKNLRAVDQIFGSDINWFSHQDDDFAITSEGYLWCYPGKVMRSAPFVLLDFGSRAPQIRKNVVGVCADYLNLWVGEPHQKDFKPR